MDAHRAHLHKLAIADLNALAVQAEESLFCRSIWLHIGTVDDDHRDSIVRIEVMPKWFTHGFTITKYISAKWKCARQIIDGSGVMQSCGCATKRIGIPELSQTRLSF